MDGSATFNTDVPAVAQTPRLAQIPNETFQLLVAILNQGHLRGDIHTWYDIVSQQHQEIIDLTTKSPTEEFQREPVIDSSIPATPSLQNPQGGYACHRCPEILKYARDFKRHVRQKCEAVEEWRCPDCSKTYRRVDHFRTHHRTQHLCSAGRCDHHTAAAHPLPSRAALGCGFCVRCFQSDLEGFLKHLIKHYDEGSTISVWNETTVVKSLLHQPHVLQVWYRICGDYFQTSPDTWSALDWNEQKVAPFIAKLEHDISFDELHEILPHLLNLGLDNYSLDPEHTLTPRPTVKSDSQYHMIGAMTPTGLNNAAFEDNIVDISYDSQDGLFEMQYPATDLASLLSGETAANSTKSSYAPSFDESFDYVGDFMDLDPMDDTSSEYMHIQPNILNTAALDDLTTGPEDVRGHTNENINNIKGRSVTVSSQETPDGALLVYPTSDHLLHIPSTEDVFLSPPNNGYGRLDEALPPFNPGPPPKPYKGHKRSVSGRIIRGLQGLASIPYLAC